MANWLSIINLQGMYTSPTQPLPLITDGVLSKISWEMEQPLGSQIVIQTRVTTNGYEWSEWRNCLNGGQVPDLNEDSYLNNAKFTFRVLIRSNSYNIIPKFKHITFEFEPVLVFDNKGDLHCKPEIWITKKENGDFSIQNLTHNLYEFKFTDLIHDETIYVNNETEDIETSLPVTYRYSNFNDHYLSFPLGKNILRIKGKADIRLRYQFKMI